MIQHVCEKFTVSAIRPWQTALQRKRCLPSSVTGPVLLAALRRLASICLRVVIERESRQLASFCYFGGRWAAADRGVAVWMPGPGSLPVVPPTDRGWGARQPTDPGGCVTIGRWQCGQPRGFIACRGGS